MNKNKRILIISRSSWSDSNNTGNTFSNIFNGWPKNNIANLYCRSEPPNNSVCIKYYQITEKSILDNMINKKRTVGRYFELNQMNSIAESNDKERRNEKKYYNFFSIYRLQFFIWLQELIWKLGRWDNKNLIEFLNDFKPDIVYTPVFSSYYSHDILKFINIHSSAKIVLFFADDYFSYKQYSYSPLYWINRIVLRNTIRRSIEIADSIYYNSIKQKQEYDIALNRSGKVLFKGWNFSGEMPLKEQLNNPIKLVFTGNISTGRWKSLINIGNALTKFNSDGIKAQLYIYTLSPMSKAIKKSFNRINSIIIMAGIPSSEVGKVQLDADILVHVESFELKHKFQTRLSFSTKIVDYLKRGRCIFAVGWIKSASIDYLMQNDAAVVAENIGEIEIKLKKLINNPKFILDYGRKSWECGKRNHQIENIRENLYNELCELDANKNDYAVNSE